MLQFIKQIAESDYTESYKEDVTTMPKLPSTSDIVSLKHSKYRNKDKVLTGSATMEIGQKHLKPNGELDTTARWSLTSAQQQEAVAGYKTLTEFDKKIRQKFETAMLAIKSISKMFPTTPLQPSHAKQSRHLRVSYDSRTAELKIDNQIKDFSGAPHAAALLRILFANKRKLGQPISWKDMYLSPRYREILENVGVTKVSQLRRTKAVINARFPERDFLIGTRVAKVNSKYLY